MSPAVPAALLDAKRQAIVAAATAAFAREGFAAARIGDIADAAKVGKGTVYEYFASKEELLIACCLARCAADRADIARALTGRMPDLAVLVPGQGPAAPLAVPADPAGALRELLTVALGHLLRHAAKDCRLFMEMFSIIGEREDLRRSVRSAILGVLEQWESILGFLIQAGIAARQFRPHPDVPGLCRMFSATVDGLLLQRSWRDDLAPEELARRTAETFLATLAR